MKTVILLPHGLAVRNFICSGFLDLLVKKSDVALVHSLSEESLREYKGRYGQRVQWYRMPTYREGIARYFLRRTFLWSHMRACNTRAMQIMLERSRPTGYSRYGVINRAAWLASQSADTAERTLQLTQVHDRLVKESAVTSEFEQLWNQILPDVILNSDQRSVHTVPGILAARKLGIPSATFIFSWDNLSSKARMPTDFDHYFVWSNLMREELLRFYPHIDPRSVHITGTPQFEPYADPAILWDYDTFCANVGASASRPIICYAGEDSSTAPEGPQHLALLCDMIRAGVIKGEPQILARPTPVDPGERYRDVLQKYPEVIWSPPRWTHSSAGSWEQAVVQQDDVRLLANIVHHCRLCVNVCSTMTLDFAIGGKPSVNIAFDIADPPPFGKPVWDVLFQFEHYQPILTLGAARVARSENELARQINEYLENPTLDATARRQLVEIEIGVAPSEANQRLVSALEMVTSGKAYRLSGNCRDEAHI